MNKVKSRRHWAPLPRLDLMPVVAIVGRPNVGKSTLFNQLTRTREALVANQPGLTRDRQYGVVSRTESTFVVVDTGGLTQSDGTEDPMSARIEDQVRRAIEQCDLIVFMLDARDGLTPEDERIGRELRQTGRPILGTLNKTDGLDPDLAASDFYALGLSELHPIAAAHGRGIAQLVETIAHHLPGTESSEATGPVPSTDSGIDSDNEQPPTPPAETDARDRVIVSIIGRPNVGKSTLVNQLVGEERVVAHDQPGTTRDSVFVPFERRGQQYVLVDTAGVRRRGKIHDLVEKFSVIKSLQAIEAANVVIFMLDATEEVAEQDLRLVGHVVDAGRALVLAINKWDAADTDARERFLSEYDRRLRFLDYAHYRTISAQRGDGLGGLLNAVDKAWAAARRDLPTPELNRVLSQAMERHQPPLHHGHRPKLRYAHQGGSNPPRIIIHGTKTEALPATYVRYLDRVFRESFDLHGTPVKLEFKTGDNPYKDRKNPLTTRQHKRRKRLMKHVKRR